MIGFHLIVVFVSSFYSIDLQYRKKLEKMKERHGVKEKASVDICNRSSKKMKSEESVAANAVFSYKDISTEVRCL